MQREPLVFKKGVKHITVWAKWIQGSRKRKKGLLNGSPEVTGENRALVDPSTTATTGLPMHALHTKKEVL
ncbi:hypothetical protein J6590_016778 [Homalodisca vitripennis]|nr:hypothetical protein J6590_016778 [Homalodisca vitripennis]